jgi:hypothetical protein
MKRLFAMFVLTPSEQRLVIFVVLLLVAGAWFKHHRDMTADDGPHHPEPSAMPLVSPTPNER